MAASVTGARASQSAPTCARAANVDDTVGRKCRCSVPATVGLAQLRDSGSEPPIVTSGDDLARLVGVLGRKNSWTAADVVADPLADVRDPAVSLI